MTTVTAKRDVRCPFSATVELAERFGHRGDAQQVGPMSGVHANVRYERMQTRDLTDETRVHDALLLRWNSSSRFPLPVLNGIITVRPNGRQTELRMDGNYEPPLGAAGRLFDAVLGKRIAQRTVHRFLNELCGFVEREWERERRSYADTAQHTE